MKEKRILAEELFAAAEEVGLTVALYAAFGKTVAVSLPFSKKECDTPIDDLEFSVRAINALKRAGAFTVGDVVDLIGSGGLMQIRNLGRKTATEIKVRIMEFMFANLTKKEKEEFFADIVKRNCF